MHRYPVFFCHNLNKFFVLVASVFPLVLHHCIICGIFDAERKDVTMPRSGGYNTRTRQLILDYLINNRQHAVSASNILEHLEAEGASPNPTTVYRYLDKLAGEQRIMKYVADKGEKAVFQYVDEERHCREHLHLKCVQCGRIYHLDCHFMDEVRAHLMAEHGFTLQCEGSVLYGLCRHCAQKAEPEGQTAQKCACCVDTEKKP